MKQYLFCEISGSHGGKSCHYHHHPLITLMMEAVRTSETLVFNEGPSTMPSH
jgi:hypothetical protein